MKLLFDGNLSHKLVSDLRGAFVGADHVRLCLAADASDEAIWRYAKVNGYTVVSKDADFVDIGFARGQPPKVIFLRFGNASTFDIGFRLTISRDAIERFCGDEVEAVLIIS